MNTKAMCSKCGHVLDDANADQCPKCCGKAGADTPASGTDQMTIIFDDAKPRSSRRQPSGTNTLPRKIGQFEVHSLLGRGGMGAVYLGYDSLLDRQVAIKVLSVSDNPSAHDVETARFLSEAVLTGRLNHGGIIPIYQIDLDADVGYYYTMRYIQGRTLGTILRLLRSGNREIAEEFSRTRLLNIFLRVCEAMAFAHRNRIVHRDLKPANIMLTDFGEVLVLDWGLAKELKNGTPADDSAVSPEMRERLKLSRQRHGTSTRIFLARGKDSQAQFGLSRLQALKERVGQDGIPELLTRHNEIVGTPQYLSPEQGSGAKDLAAASDVYSLGVILYEILTGCMPVDSANPVEIVVKTVRGEIVPIESRPEAFRIPKVLTEMTARALHNDPSQRYRDASELAHDLALYLEGRSPWKRIAADDFKDGPAGPLWRTEGGSLLAHGGSLRLSTGARAACLRKSLGDFRCLFRVEPDADQPEWILAFRIYDERGGQGGAQYELRMGVTSRAFVDLFRNGKRVMRRLDLRMQSGQSYEMRVELEGESLRLYINGQKQLHYKEFFPQTGGAVEFFAENGMIAISSFEMLSSGSPLSLSFLALPDRQYRLGRYAEGRELYRQLAQSHPDREEGLMAMFKAGLCSTELSDTQTAYADFAQLEGTMFDHLCALGLARIGLVDGNIDWAWESLKHGYLRHREQEIRTAMWFALLSLIESIGLDRGGERVARCLELLRELEPENLERAQLVYDLLDFSNQMGGLLEMRSQAARLLEQFPDDPVVASEALQAIWRAGINESALDLVAPALEQTLKRETNVSIKARLELLACEIAMARCDFDRGLDVLRDATVDAGMNSPDGMWAQGWQVMALYLKEDFRQALTKAHETLVRHRRKNCSQLTYIKVIESLCYLGRDLKPIGERTLKAAALYKDIWGWAAEHSISNGSPEQFLDRCAQSNSNLAIEALFLIGEIHWRLGRQDQAMAFYQTCTQHPYSRAMINRLIKLRQHLHTNSRT